MTINKIRKAEISKKYYLSHKNKILQYQKLYKIKNKETLSKRDKDYYKKNKIHFKEYRQKNKDIISANKKIYRLRLRYGLTLEEKEKIFKKQNYICPICLKILDESKIRTVVIDHCHKTKKVRGIIHMKCNLALGYLEDNPSFFINASNYLKQNIFKERRL